MRHLNPYTVRLINAEETIPIRHAVLRINKPIASCYFLEDHVNTSFHLGLFFKKTLIGVATFLKNNHPNFSENSQYQLRGMAILQAHQNKGLGGLLLNQGMLELKKVHANRIWCHAREAAVHFYRKNGFKTIGDPFYITDIGFHFLMTLD
ncbi:GNAT family N-acetyltransferase [Bizionia sediminis]|uniref:GNAT family N-acetyltransferase n=1 Tax=Bizionia sediminis TaxID=1737064 RepID=A0ABW5KWH9_9FLAO